VVVVLYLTYNLRSSIVRRIYRSVITTKYRRVPSILQNESFGPGTNKETAPIADILDKATSKFFHVMRRVCIVTVLQVLYIKRSSSWLSAYLSIYAVNPRLALVIPEMFAG
jgi:hypothetical protein